MRVEEILKQYWGYDDFRGIQREIIDSIMSGHDTVGLMPTGGGKSITFQVPAIAMEGVCLVVTPLIALMKDQVQHLRKIGISAAAIYSGMSRDEILMILENAIFGKTKLLYISPERLSSDIFQTKCRHMHVSFITVDEAHCISQWGYDFRPSYLRIADVRTLHPDVPVLALTATATPPVVQDIQDKLSLTGNSFNLFRMSFERKNLAYVVRHTDDKMGEMLHILSRVGGSAIVYVRSRRRTKEIADMLTANGLCSTYYHAGLDHATKDNHQRDWQTDATRIIVATNAFGMGIDKPDVRVVIHFDCPDSIEAYFQEAGRAGRDGQKSYAVLLFGSGDATKLRRRIAETFPDKDFVREVYDHLAYYYQVGIGSGAGKAFEFDIDEFCRRFRHFPVQVESSLHILQRAGYIEYTEMQESMARVHFLVTRETLYRLENAGESEDKVIVAILRNYGGLFSDFGFIDESIIARDTHLSVHQVYMSLRNLHQRHILHFIPRKQTPYIRYTQRRDDGCHLHFPPSIYEELKERYAARIEAMISYATNDSISRSQQLLRYFGESSEPVSL